MDWLGGLRKWPFLLTFSILFILPCADNADIVGGSEKVQECADVIYGWSLSYLLLYFVASDEFDEELGRNPFLNFFLRFKAESQILFLFII